MVHAPDAGQAVPTPTAAAVRLPPRTPVTALPGIGPGAAEKLARLGVRTLLDLLLPLPSSKLARSVRRRP